MLISLTDVFTSNAAQRVTAPSLPIPPSEKKKKENTKNVFWNVSKMWWFLFFTLQCNVLKCCVDYQCITQCIYSFFTNHRTCSQMNFRICLMCFRWIAYDLFPVFEVLCWPEASHTMHRFLRFPSGFLFNKNKWLIRS